MVVTRSELLDSDPLCRLSEDRLWRVHLGDESELRLTHCLILFVLLFASSACLILVCHVMAQSASRLVRKSVPSSLVPVPVLALVVQAPVSPASEA